jgi:hypothetical protein
VDGRRIIVFSNVGRDSNPLEAFADARPHPLMPTPVRQCLPQFANAKAIRECKAMSHGHHPI